MKSITVHNLDDNLYQLINSSAKKNKRSMSREIKEWLTTIYLKQIDENQASYYKKFLGIWTEEEKNEFQRNTEDFNKIDESDWQ
jgi:hypothetical protein